MATSTRDPGLPVDGSARWFSRYDLLLLVIPVTFLVALLVGMVSSLAVSTLFGAASLVSAIVVADGLFVNPPLER